MAAHSLAKDAHIGLSPRLAEVADQALQDLSPPEQHGQYTDAVKTEVDNARDSAGTYKF